MNKIELLESKFPSEVVEIPEETKELIRLLSDANYSLVDVDIAMGKEVGWAREKLKRWPMLREIVKESRILAMREAGLDKKESYRKYVEAQSATKRELSSEDENGNKSYEEVADHKTRVLASDRVLMLLGEKPLSGTVVNVSNQTLNVDISIKNEIAIIARDAVEKARLEAQEMGVIKNN